MTNALPPLPEDSFGALQRPRCCGRCGRNLDRSREDSVRIVTNAEKMVVAERGLHRLNLLRLRGGRVVIVNRLLPDTVLGPVLREVAEACRRGISGAE